MQVKAQLLLTVGRRMAAAAVWRVLLRPRALVRHQAPSTASHSVRCAGEPASLRADRRRQAGGMSARALLQASGPQVVAAMAAPVAPELVLRPVPEVESIAVESALSREAAVAPARKRQAQLRGTWTGARQS